METVIKKAGANLNGRCYVSVEGYLGDDDDLVTSSGRVRVFNSYRHAAEMADGLAKHYPCAAWVIERA